MFPQRPDPSTDRAAVRRYVLAHAPNIDGPAFTQLGAADLRMLFEQYDARSFDGVLTRSLARTPLSFRVSRRMTNSLGLTYRYSPPLRFEIVVSTTLLFGNFDPGDRPVLVCGLPAADRLEALQLVFEHELVHLAELVAFGHSDCAADRYAGIAHGLFGHREHQHRLITPRERAAEQGLLVGARVRFVLKGRRYEGTINRITRRATVLVRDPKGDRYSDGQRYTKFYVPLGDLSPAD